MLLPLQTHQPTMGVYQIELNEKRYIGSSSQDIQGRWESHLYDLRRGNHPNRHLQNAYNKYGEELLKFSVLEVVEIPEDCIIIEQKYIDSINPEDAYNICPIAGSRLGTKHREESKQKMSLAKMGMKHSEETKQKHRDRGISEESRQKMRLAQLGTHHTEESRQKMHISNLRSEETRQKMSKTHLGTHHHTSEETKRKISLARLGTHPTEETKQKMRLAKLGTHPTEEHKQKNRLAQLGNTHALGRHHTEETKQKIRDTLLRRKEALI